MLPFILSIAVPIAVPYFFISMLAYAFMMERSKDYTVENMWVCVVMSVLWPLAIVVKFCYFLGWVWQSRAVLAAKFHHLFRG